MACSLAKKAKGMVYALYIIEVGRELPIDAEIGEETSRGEEILAHIEDLARHEKCSLEAEILQARQAGPAIVREALERQVDIIVAGTGFKRNIGNFNIGDTTSYLLRHSRCPVLLFRQGILSTGMGRG